MRIRLAFVAITAATLAIVACEPVHPAPYSGPPPTVECVEEDGSGQHECVWNDSDGRSYHVVDGVRTEIKAV